MAATPAKRRGTRGNMRRHGFFLTDQQVTWLRQQGAELGIPEAEILRRLIDTARARTRARQQEATA